MAPPESASCPAPGCDYNTRAGIPTHELLMRDLEFHGKHAHPDPRGAAQDGGARETAAKPKELPRPEIGEEASESDWNHFVVKWNRYKRSCLTRSTDQHTMDQLWACCSPELERSIYRTGGNEATEATLMESMKKMSVKRQNTLVNIVTFLGLGQDADEPVKHYAARLRGQASICNFQLPAGETSYVNHMVKFQLVRGLADPVIQEQVLAHYATQTDVGNIGLDQTLNFVEAKESGKHDSSAISNGGLGGLNRVSEYRAGQNRSKQAGKPTDVQQKPLEGSKDACGWCKKTGHGAKPSEQTRKTECPAYGKSCLKCGAMHHFRSACRSKKPTPGVNQVQTPEVNTDSDGANNAITFGHFYHIMAEVGRADNARTIDHKTFSKVTGWQSGRPEPHPLTAVSVQLCRAAYPDLGVPRPRERAREVKVMAMPDTGAQMCIAGLNLVHAMGMTKRDLFPVSTTICGANNQPINLLGGALITISGQEGKTTHQMCYISNDCHILFIPKGGCRDLGLIDEKFPGGESGSVHACVGTEEEADPGEPCKCPDREEAPDTPKETPFPATAANRGKLQEWILNRYQASAFNQCARQTLPEMKGSPPMRLHVNPETPPVAIHKSRPVPIHWQEEVKAGLDRDVRIGVLERVPMGEPVRWCAPMHVCPKKNGKPRRTVDLQALNRAAMRQTHTTESPFHQVSGIPANKLKTVLDCWNGYHSVSLEEEDRHLTTFLTPWGKYRYKRAPQGFLAAGDAYTARFDRILEGWTDYKKCIDDTCLFDDSIETNFFRTCEFLTTCSRAGIVFNKDKFVFAQEEVDFVGFTVTMDGVKPSREFIKAVEEFPTPRDLTGVRSWFGLINQVNYAYSQSSLMLPFRHLLKPGEKFAWTEEINKSFEDSKLMLTALVEKGVKTFEIGRWTALVTDWSKTGIGFVLLQKHCQCAEVTPLCCKTGWRLTFAGSRFTSPAESRYAPVEGELLGVAWSLKKTRFFTIGCEKLIVAGDHKPLLKILGDRSFEDMENARLQNLKEKTLTHRFKAMYIPGKDNQAADCHSRTPGVTGGLNCIQVDPTEEEIEEANQREQMELARAESQINAMGGPRVISWEELDNSSRADNELCELNRLVTAGCPEDKRDWPANISQYFPHRADLSTVGNVVTAEGRVVVPRVLREEVTEVLHSAHQGTSAMAARARETVFWPNMMKDITRRREQCNSCDAHAPSQPAAPPHPLPEPQFPFQMVVSDYLQWGGHHYFLFCDRYSGWTTVYKSTKDGASELITKMRDYMATFGVMEELASDRGSQYTAWETKSFLQRFNVQHRLSSAYFPHSNQRAEGAVKQVKRLIRENTGPGGTLNTDKFLRALLMLRNTPDRESGLSPAEVVFGRKLRDCLPISPGKLQMRKEWKETLVMREAAMARRHEKRGQELSEHTKTLDHLPVGQAVSIQNQAGNLPKRWGNTGTVVEAKPFDQYVVMVDGSRHLTIRNRKFLRPINPYSRQREGNTTLVPATTPATHAATTPATDPATDPATTPAPPPAPILIADTLRRSERTRREPSRFQAGQ